MGEQGWGVFLDTRPYRTPLRNPLDVPISLPQTPTAVVWTQMTWWRCCCCCCCYWCVIKKKGERSGALRGTQRVTQLFGNKTLPNATFCQLSHDLPRCRDFIGDAICVARCRAVNVGIRAVGHIDVSQTLWVQYTTPARVVWWNLRVGKACLTPRVRHRSAAQYVNPMDQNR